MRINRIIDKTLPILLAAVILFSVIWAPLFMAVNSKAASTNPSDYGLPSTLVCTGQTVDNVMVAAVRNMGTGIAGSSVDSTYQYTVGGAGPAMCINPSLGGPQGRTGPEAQFYSTYRPFSSNAGQENWAGALSSLTVSQIVAGGLEYAGNNTSRWTFVHALLSYVLGSDSSWINSYTSTAGEAAVYGMARSLASSASSVSQSASFWVFHIAGKQSLVTLVRGTPEVTSGVVRIRKVDQNGDKVAGAVITLTSTSAGTVDNLSANVGFTRITNGIQIVTDGVTDTYEFSGLRPNSTYTFTEPENGVPVNYMRADPPSVSFTTGANGNPVVSGSGWNTSTYTYTMVDRTVPTGSVSFNKVTTDSATGQYVDLLTAGIEFKPYGHSLDMSVNGPVSVVDNTGTMQRDSERIIFTTSAVGVDIEFSNLPAGQYILNEISTPDGMTTAQPIVVNVAADGSVTPNNGVIQMVNSIATPSLFGSIGIVKVWEGQDYVDSNGNVIYSDESFYSDISTMIFRMFYLGHDRDWVMRYTRDSQGNFLDGAPAFAEFSGNRIYDMHGITNQSVLTGQRDANGNYCFAVPWTYIKDSNGSYIGPYSSDHPRYFEYYDPITDAWYEENGWDREVIGLPRDRYYLVAETWTDASLSPEGNEMFIQTENASPYWHLRPSFSGNGTHYYFAVFYIGNDGVTYICDYETLTPQAALNVAGSSTVAIWQQYYQGFVTNRELTGALDVVKTDESGSGVDGVRFEVHSATPSSMGYVLANGTISYQNPTVDENGYQVYSVDWDYWKSFEQQTNGSWDRVRRHITGQSAMGNLPYGDYYVYEFIEDTNGNSIIADYLTPDGWEAYDADGDGITDYFRKLVHIDTDSHITPLQIPISNRQHRLNITVEKIDESTGSILAGYTGGSDATFAIYQDVNLNDVIDSEDLFIGEEADSDRDGIVRFTYMLDELYPNITDPSDYPSRYLVIETGAPDGYYLNSTAMTAVCTVTNGYRFVLQSVDTPFIQLNFGIDKYDEWTGSVLNGYGGIYDATFELWVDVNANGQIDAADRLLDTVSDTNRDGMVDVQYVLDYTTISSKFPECINANGGITGESAKNYPTEYLVREVTAPFDFYLNDTVLSITLDGHRYAETATRTEVTDTPYTAQVRLFKIDADTGAEIQTAQFTVYNDVDLNGIYTEGIDTVAQTFSRTENRLVDVQCVWNMAENCYLSSPLRSGHYVVVETGLPEGFFYVSDSGQPSLSRNEVSFVINGRDTSASGFMPDVYEATVYNIKPSIHTTFIDELTASHIAHIETDIELTDIVAYENLVPGLEYRLSGVIMLKRDGMPLLDENGQQITGQTVFTPDSSDGTVEVVFHLDTIRLMGLIESGQIEAPIDIVCFEQLGFASDADMTPYHQWYDDNPIAVHEDINDGGQTVRVGKVETGVYDNQTLSQVASLGPDGDGYAVIVDHCYYEGLQPGVEYTMSGTMHLLGYDEYGNAIDAGAVTGSDPREVLNPSTVFIPSEHKGYVDVTYVINTNRFRGQTMVSFEDLYYGTSRVMWHADIEDLAQTLFIPSVHTNAYCPDTTPNMNGRTVITYGERARIVDEVSYSNLLVDGRQYMVQGVLYWVYTDDNGYIHSGPVSDLLGDVQAMSTAYFTPDRQDGTVELTFTFDSRALSDLGYDKLIVCETLYANGGIGWEPIAHHWDFSMENNSQSIEIPQIRTTAYTPTGSILPEAESVQIVDRVWYENLIPGIEYTVVGNVQYALTDENGSITESGALVQNGQEVKAQTSFVPESSSGFVEVSFTVNALDVHSSGVDKLIVFEELYSAPGVLVSMHADIEDDYQTIDVCNLASSASGPDGSRSVSPSRDITVTDTVYYEGFIPGHEYRMETDLMNSSTGVSDAHCSTVFCPETSDGSIDITIMFDGSDYTTEKMVVFERVYDNHTGSLVKSHCDWNEVSQTITFMPQTGIIKTNEYRYKGIQTLMIGACAFVVWYVIPEKKKEKGYAEHKTSGRR